MDSIIILTVYSGENIEKVDWCLENRKVCLSCQT